MAFGANGDRERRKPSGKRREVFRDNGTAASMPFRKQARAMAHSKSKDLDTRCMSWAAHQSRKVINKGRRAGSANDEHTENNGVVYKIPKQ